MPPPSPAEMLLSMVDETTKVSAYVDWMPPPMHTEQFSGVGVRATFPEIVLPTTVRPSAAAMPAPTNRTSPLPASTVLSTTTLDVMVNRAPVERMPPAAPRTHEVTA